MQKNILLPQVELTMENVTVVNWLVQVGDRVQADQNLIEVESQKGIVEVPAAAGGYLRALCVKAGDTIGEKALLCVLTDTADEAFTAREDARPPANLAIGAPGGRASSRAALEFAGQATGAVEPVREAGPIRAVPAARKLAKELGIDLATVKGSGPEGRISVDDVAKRKPQSEVAGAADGWSRLSPARIALIAQMQKSLAEIPQFHLARRLDVGPLTVKSEGITFTHRLVKAVGHALAQHPILRSVIQGDRIKTLPVNVAIAIETPTGLVAPAVRNADQLSIEQIAARVKDLRQRAETGTSRRDDLVDAPFAISNLGMLGVDFFSPFVFHGQTAVLAVGRAVDGLAWFNLALDHRIVDGAEGARFLETLQQGILS